MIEVTCKLISAIHPSRDEVLGVIKINNDLKTSVETAGRRGSYKFSLSKRGNKGIWKEGRVENFDRKQRGCYDLLYLGLKEIVGSRNK